jgi:hypothetical protein
MTKITGLEKACNLRSLGNLDPSEIGVPMADLVEEVWLILPDNEKFLTTSGIYAT